MLSCSEIWHNVQEEKKKKEKKKREKKKLGLVHFKIKAFKTQLHQSPAQKHQLQSTDCNMGPGAFPLFSIFVIFRSLFFYSLDPTGLMESKHTTIQESDVYIPKTHGGKNELSQTDPRWVTRSP